MLEFLTLKPEAFGLDISDLSLKIVKLKKSKDFLNLASLGEQSIKPGVIKKGEIKKEEDLVEIIKNVLNEVKGEKIKTKYVVASLPEEKAFLQIIQMPRMSTEDLKSAVIYEAENYIPLPVEEVYLDFQVIHPVNHLKNMEILITALPKKTIDSYVTCFKKAGLEIMALEVESLAIARALIKDEWSTSPLLLIDLGATRTGLAIFSGRSLRFTSSIPVSSRGFTEIISKGLGIDLSRAEGLKIKHGLEKKVRLKIKEKVEKTSEGTKTMEIFVLFEALIPALTDLIQQIKKYLNYYRTHTSHEHLPTNGKEVEKILLCGGGANLKGLPEFLSLRLKLPVELGNPWINILPESQKEVPTLPFKKSLSYTTALGLALRGIRGRKT